MSIGRWVAACAVGWLCCVCAMARADGPVWRSPGELQVVVLHGHDARKDHTSDDGDLNLRKDDVALIAVRRGAWLRVTGAPAEIGLAYGDVETEASVVWDAVASKAERLRVPSFSQARWVAVRGEGAVRIETTASPTDAMARSRFREAMVAWLWSGGPMPHAGTDGEARTLRLAGDALHLFGGFSAAGVRPWVWAQYEELASEEARVAAPWFLSTSVSGAVASSRGRRQVDGASARVSAGEALLLGTAEGEILNLSLRGVTLQPSAATVRVGDRVLRQLWWSGQDRTSGDGWSSRARVVRVPLGDVARVSVTVTQGKVSVAWAGNVRAKSVLEMVGVGTPPVVAPGSDPASLAVDMARGEKGAVERAMTFVETGHGTAAVTAFVAAELARLSADSELRRRFAVVALRDGVLPDGMRARLAEQLLHAGIVLPAAACPTTVDETDPESLAGYAVLRVLCGASAGRPSASMMVESIAKKFPSSERWSNLARHLVSSETRWRDARPTTRTDVKETYSVVNDGAADGLCAAAGQYGLRWSVLAAGQYKWRMGAPGRVAVRVERSTDGWEGIVRFDDVSVVVHGAAALTSSVQLAAGDHVVSVPKDAPPLLVRWPREGRIPCDGLRDRAVLVPFEGDLAFAMPHEGAESVARVQLLAREGKKLPAQVDILVGDERTRVSLFSRGIAEFEVALHADTSSLTVVSGDASAFARVRVLASDALEADPAVEQRIAARTPDAWLEDVERLSSALATAGEGDRPALLTARAYALFALGFRWYAFRDWAAAGGTEQGFEGLRLPAESSDVVDNIGRMAPVGDAATPSTAATDAALLRQLRHWIEQGLTENALGRLTALRTEDAATVGPGVARVLAMIEADTSERVGDLPRAAAAWSRVGDPYADLEAARLWSRIARAGMDASAWSRSLAHAVRAKVTDGGALASVSRASDRVTWVRAAASMASAGSMVIAEATARDAVPGTSARVRAAMIHAPPGAFLLYEGEFLTLRTKLRAPRTLRFEGHCEAEFGDDACGFVVRVDGETVAESDRELEVSVPAGPHQLEIEPKLKALAWLRPLAGTDEATPAPARRWFVADKDHPVRFVARGPSAARLELRTSVAASFDVFLDGVLWQTVPAPADGTVEVLAPILGDQPVEVAVHVASGRGLVRAAFASDSKFGTGDGPVPRPLPLHRATADRGGQHTYEGQGSSVANARAPWPFSYAFTARIVGAEFRDLDVGAGGAPYLELSPELLRTFGGGFYFGAGAFVRMRGGPSSLGGRLRLETPEHGLLPRIIFRGQFTTQDLEGWFSGYALRASAVWRVPITPIFALYPILGARYMRVAEVPAGIGNVDPDVYSFNDDMDPLTASGELVGYIRPWIDVTARVRARAVYAAESAKVDRAEVGASLDSVAGAGLAPWVSVSYLASYRFETLARERAYLRHIIGGSLFFWRWGNAQNRVGLGVDARYIPGENLAECSLVLSYLGARHRGVMDLPRGEVEHRDRMNENGDVAEELGRSSWGVPGRIDAN